MWDFCTFVMGSHDIGEQLYVHVRSPYYQYLLRGFEFIRVLPSISACNQIPMGDQQQSRGSDLHMPISRC